MKNKNWLVKRYMNLLPALVKQGNMVLDLIKRAKNKQKTLKLGHVYGPRKSEKRLRQTRKYVISK